jgi:hypothetical protein
MPFPNDEAKKFISEHLVAFLLAGAVVLLPLLGAYAYIVSEYKTLNETRVTTEKDRVAIKLEAGQAKLEIEKLQTQLASAMDASKKLLEEISVRQKQTESEKQQLADGWKKVDLMRQMLNPAQEFKILSEEFTLMGVDLNRCTPMGEQEKNQRARLVAQRIWYAAIQTNLAANIAFARNIQPASNRSYSCY